MSIKIEVAIRQFGRPWIGWAVDIFVIAACLFVSIGMIVRDGATDSAAVVLAAVALYAALVTTARVQAARRKR